MQRMFGSLIGLALLAAGCAQEGSTPRAEATASVAASPARSAAPADPLEGEWRTEFTCEEELRAIERHLSSKQIREAVGSIDAYMGDAWGGEPTKDDPCHGATGTRVLILRFADGYIALTDGGDTVTAPYELVDDRAINVSDAQENFCYGTQPRTACPARWGFEIVGDDVTFHVTPDIDVISAWESAPFVRVS